MDKHAAPEESNRAKRRKYRDEYEEKHAFMRSRAKFKAMVPDRTEMKIEEVFIVPSIVDMESFIGTEHELAYAMEELYANYGL